MLVVAIPIGNKFVGQKGNKLRINNPMESESEYLADSNSLKDYDHAIFVRIIFNKNV